MNIFPYTPFRFAIQRFVPLHQRKRLQTSVRKGGVTVSQQLFGISTP